MELTTEQLQSMVDSSGKLYLGDLRITELPALPLGLRKLDIINVPLKGLPSLPEGLEELWCSNTHVTRLPALPASLKVLEINQSPVTELPPLPFRLQKLFCDLTHITEFPDLNHLTELDTFTCRGCQIQLLPRLPLGLQTLDCTFSSITRLPGILPPGLRHLDCSRTQLTELPPLPSGIIMNCNNCPLLAELPDVTYTLVVSCDNCPSLPIQFQYHQSINDWKRQWAHWNHEQSKLRCQARNETIKEDLIAEFWKPSRVEKMLELGGWDLVDSY